MATPSTHRPSAGEAPAKNSNMAQLLLPFAEFAPVMATRGAVAGFRMRRYVRKAGKKNRSRGIFRAPARWSCGREGRSRRLQTRSHAGRSSVTELMLHRRIVLLTAHD